MLAARPALVAWHDDFGPVGVQLLQRGHRFGSILVVFMP